MSRRLLENARQRLATEAGLSPAAPGGRLNVALVFPNVYAHAMGNLGYQTVYRLLNQHPGARCERFFLPDPDDLAEHRKTGFPLFSLESQTPLADFDLIAFSISFENDYLHLPLLFDLARLPLWREERGERHPLVICGGVCAFLNPEPLAEIFDAFAIGEAEVLLPPLVDLLIGAPDDRQALLQALGRLPGFYIPAAYTVAYLGDGTVAAYRPEADVPARVVRQWLADLDHSAATTVIYSPTAEFGDMSLTEVSRGCSRGCRFCAAGYLFLPPRERSLEALRHSLEDGLCHRSRQGLVGAAVSDHSRIAELQQLVLAGGGSVSVSSLRLDALNPENVAALTASGHRTVAIAPEAGSQRLRDLINKGLDEEQILAAVKLLAAAAIPNLKVYLLLGLPTEEERDIDELLALTAKIRTVWLEEGKKLGRLGHLTLSLNPFIPKPFTPLQWAGMAEERQLEARLKRIRTAVARMANVSLICESLRAAQLQAFFSRGDRRCGRTLPLLAAGSNLRAACRAVELDPAFYVTRERGADECFPWEVLDSGVERRHLWREYQKGLSGVLSPRCAPDCRRCGVCH